MFDCRRVFHYLLYASFCSGLLQSLSRREVLLGLLLQPLFDVLQSLHAGPELGYYWEVVQARGSDGENVANDDVQK